MADLVMGESLRTIRLYGVLGREFGRTHEFVVNSPVEAIRVLCSMVKGFEKFLTEAKDKGLTFGVFVGKKNVTREELDWSLGKDDIRIAPVIQGSKRAGLIQTIVGVVLLVASFFYPVLLPLAVSMLAGGIAAMLAPQTKGLSAKDDVNNRPSYAFNGPINTSAQGNPIPVLYGELIIGSAVISAGIYAEDQQ